MPRQGQWLEPKMDNPLAAACAAAISRLPAIGRVNLQAPPDQRASGSARMMRNPILRQLRAILCKRHTPKSPQFVNLRGCPNLGV